MCGLFFEVNYLNVEEFGPVGTDEEEDALSGAVQGDAAHQEREQDQVGEEGREVGDFAGRRHSAHEHGSDERPGQQQAQQQFHVGRPDTVVDVVPFLHHSFSVESSQEH